MSKIQTKSLPWEPTALQRIVQRFGQGTLEVLTAVEEANPDCADIIAKLHHSIHELVCELHIREASNAKLDTAASLLLHCIEICTKVGGPDV